MTRKMVLMLALFAALGFGFGWISEDLCCLGGPYADDPNTPVVAAEYALPSHVQAAPKAAQLMMAVRAGMDTAVPLVTLRHSAGDQSSIPSSFQNPRRC